MKFTWRDRTTRPPINCAVGPVPYSAWRTFAPFHYLTNACVPQARCFVLSADGRPAAFAAMLHRPHPKRRNLFGLSRLVTLPDWQGLGLAFVLADTLARAYAAFDYEMRCYPAHPALIRSYQKNANWLQVKEAGEIFSISTNANRDFNDHARPCAIFRWCGPRGKFADALTLLNNPLHRLEPFNPKRRV